MADFSLQNKTAVVTGGSRGIGLEIARALAKAGADVAIVSRTATSSPNLMKEFEDLGRKKSFCFDADVCRKSEVLKFAEEVRKRWEGRVDILVNNAGVCIHKPALDLEEEETPKRVLGS